MSNDYHEGMELLFSYGKLCSVILETGMELQRYTITTEKIEKEMLIKPWNLPTMECLNLQRQ